MSGLNTSIRKVENGPGGFQINPIHRLSDQKPVKGLIFPPKGWFLQAGQSSFGHGRHVFIVAKSACQSSKNLIGSPFPSGSAHLPCGDGRFASREAAADLAECPSGWKI